MQELLYLGDILLFTRINQEWIAPGLDPLMELFSSVPALWTILIVATTLLVRRCWKKTPKRFDRECGLRKILASCLLLACSVAVTEGVTYAIKHYSDRQRPYHTLAGTRYPDGDQWGRRPFDAPARTKPGSSFVSGHASNSMALAVTLTYVCPPLKPFIYALPLCVGYSRIYLGRHYPSDVAAGWILGWLLSSCICRVFHKRSARSGVAFMDHTARPAATCDKIQPENTNMKPLADSVVLIIPVYNEENNLPILFAEILGAMGMQHRPWQVLFVDDGSSDGSLAILRDLADSDARVHYLSFARNCGQSAAFAAGFRHAEGTVFVTLDADLQNDSMDIPRMLAVYDEGYGMVTGWRADRKDTSAKRLASKLANRIRNCISRETIKDTGCSLKVLNAAIAQELPMFTGMHRFLPTLMKMRGVTVAEVKVNHRAREYGTSKYGITWSRIYLYK